MNEIINVDNTDFMKKYQKSESIMADIQNIIGYLRDRGIGILITDHNVVETLRIVDRAYILNEGKILVEGDVDTILNDPLARRYYIGENTKL